MRFVASSFVFLMLLAVLAPGCGGSSVGASGDTQVDTGGEPDADAAGDTGAGDATGDADTAAPPDATPDVEPDAEPPACTTDQDCVAQFPDLGDCQVAVCTPAGTCATENAEDGAACDFADPCTAASACVDGVCEALAPVDCDDLDLCTVDACDAETGECSHTAPDCADTDLCTVDGCDAATGECTHEALDCTDTDLCTVDACDAETGECTHEAPDCADTDLCTVDACDAETGECTHEALDCTDTDLCTVDACDAATGECTHTAADCADTDLCTVDACDAATGECTHTPADCADTDPCTVDACDAATGECTHTALDCNDDDACTTDACVDGQCETEDVVCDDGVDCTADTCDPDVGCVYDHTACPTTETNCADGFDDDLDGATDCDDPDCEAAPLCVGGYTCELPEPITEPGAYAVDTTGLADAFAATCQPDTGAEAVFEVTAAAGTTVCVDTFATAFDTVLTARAACEPTAAELACNDDSGAGTTSEIEFEMPADGLAYVVLDGYAGAAGPATLNVRFAACATVEACEGGLDDDGDGLADCTDPDCADDDVCICHADPQEPNDTAATAKPLALDAPLDLSLCAGDTDWFTFTLDAAADLTIETAGALGDTVLALFDDAGALVAENDDADYPYDLFSRVRLMALPAGTYTVQVRAFDVDTEILAYTLSAFTCIADDYENDDVPVDARLLEPGVAQTHSICPDGDIDWLGLLLDEPADIVIETSGAEGYDTFLSFYDADGQLLFTDDDGAGVGFYSRLEIYEVPAGVWYVTAESYDGSRIPAYDIELTTTTLACPADDGFEPNDTRATATPVTAPFFGRGIACSGDADWFAFPLEAGCQLVSDLVFVPGDGDLNLTLTNATGTVLATGAPTDDGEQIAYEAPAAGTYALQVAGAAGASNRYFLFLIALCPEVCADGVDNDGDDAVDCADPDCAADPGCIELLCSDGVDNDGDTLADCADPDCVADPACADDDYEDNDTPAEAAAGPLETTDLVSAYGDEDWYAYTLCAGGTLDVDIAFVHDQGDLDLLLFSAADPTNPLDASEGYDDEESVTWTNAGAAEDLLVLVLNYTSGSVNPYELSAFITCPEDCGNGSDDDGDGLTDCLDVVDCAAAPECTACADAAFEPDAFDDPTPLTAGLVSRQICPVGESDWFGFTLAAETRVIVETRPPAGQTEGDTYMRLFDAAHAQIEFDDDDGPGWFSRIDRTLAAGSYVVEVEELGDNALLAYDIFFGFPTTEVCSGGLDEDLDGATDCADSDCTSAPACLYCGDTNEPDSYAAPTLLPVGTLPRALCPVGDNDYFRFQLARLSDVILETAGPSGDTRMYLYSDPGTTQLEWDDDDGPGNFSRIERTGTNALPAGTYYVKIDEFNNDARIPQFTLTLQVTEHVEDCGNGSDDDGDSLVDCDDPDCAGECVPGRCPDPDDAAADGEPAQVWADGLVEGAICAVDNDDDRFAVVIPGNTAVTVTVVPVGAGTASLWTYQTASFDPAQQIQGAADLTTVVIDNSTSPFYMVRYLKVLSATADDLGYDLTFAGYGFTEPPDPEANLGFEVPWEAGTVPSGYTLTPSGFQVNYTTSSAHSGTGAAQVVYSSNTRYDTYTLYPFPVIPGQAYTFTYWVLDTGAGRIRQALRFYDSANAAISPGSDYSSVYTADSPNWTQYTYTRTAPANAAYAKVFFRTYDAAGTVLVDDLSLTSP